MNRRSLLIAAAATPALGVPALRSAEVKPGPDPLLALVAEWNALSEDVNRSTVDIDPDDWRMTRQHEIETAIMAGVAPTTVAGAIAGLMFARRELAPQIMAGEAAPTAAEAFERDPGDGLAVAVIDAVVQLLSEGSA